MRKVSSLFVAIALLSTSPAFGGLVGRGLESWYMSRARSNMEIANYKAAIEAYEKALETNPENREALRNLGFAYESQGFKDKSIEQFDRYLEKYPDDGEVSLKQAQALSWSRYSYRKKDALKYYKAGLSQKEDTQVRLKYARLLASDKENNGEAIRQYQKILSKNPSNAEAHRGLAKAYAWEGENDKALYESEQAKKYGGGGTEIVALEKDLRAGREPELSAHALATIQPDPGFDLYGFAFSVAGRMDLSPFVTGSAEMGLESYWNGSSQSSTGGFFRLEGEFRPDERNKASLSLGYHGLSPITSAVTAANTGSSSNNLTTHLRYWHDFEGWSLATGFQRELRTDSFLALVGSRLFGSGLGQARSNLFYAQIESEAGSSPLIRIKPYVGWVSALSVPANFEMGIDARLTFRLAETGNLTVSLDNLFQVFHFGMDQSGSSGQGAGYFSPAFFFGATPKFLAELRLSEVTQLEVGAGPALQLVSDNSPLGAFRLGQDLNAGCTAHFAEKSYLHGDVSYRGVGGVYNQVLLGVQWIQKF